ncbi:MAG: tyrosine--tRNA ligase [Planctomycetota bacterium]|nr:tyrosine--tRNA ligase [Planctomycetota bacterium]
MKKVLSAGEQLARLKKGVVEVFPEEEMVAKLERSVATKTPLRVKLGIDPTTPDLHLGHIVVLNKLRQFQQLGHRAVLIIGDYTGQVGDPSGQSATRQRLRLDDVNRNAEVFLTYARRLLSDGELEIRRNGEWFAPMSFAEVMELASKMTVARLLERDDFKNRFEKNVPISLHEFFYPLMQGYDSVMVKADVELGGTDQRYNLSVGRALQRDFGQEPQVCITLPLLVGTDGEKKMSKTYNNFIRVDEPPKTMFDKLFSIPDSLVQTYLTLLTDIEETEIKRLCSASDIREAKLVLATDVVKRFAGEKAAESLRESYIGGTIPEEGLKDVECDSESIWIVNLVKSAGFASSSSEARRLVQQGGVSLDGETISNPEQNVNLKDGMVLKVGKNRWARIRIKREKK